jgi:hypothetical protein
VTSRPKPSAAEQAKASRKASPPSKAAAPQDAPTPPKAPAAPRIGSSMSSSGLAQRIASPRSLAEAEVEYVRCRDAWTAAMRAASSGRPADLATLAICQEAYEAATVERDRWLSGARVAVPVEPETRRAPFEVVVDQVMAWRDVHEHGKPRGVLGRLFGRRSKG